MKKLLAALFIAGAVAPVQASQHGCTVLLCLANPPSNGGPRGVSECVPPINKLYRDLRKGRRFPTCDKEDGNDGASYARQVYDPYDHCPPTLQPARRGANVAHGTKSVGGSSRGWWGGNGTYTLAGPVQTSEPQSYDGDRYKHGARACVGNLLGSFKAYNGSSRDYSYVVNVYDKVVWQRAQNPRAIDVYIDNKHQQRVRW